MAVTGPLLVEKEPIGFLDDVDIARAVIMVIIADLRRKGLVCCAESLLLDAARAIPSKSALGKSLFIAVDKVGSKSVNGDL